jgi:signal transduction histidine kinase/CheY-like chemotaxis protein
MNTSHRPPPVQTGNFLTGSRADGDDSFSEINTRESLRAEAPSAIEPYVPDAANATDAHEPAPAADVSLASVVHEVQNVLASVLGWVQLSRDSTDPALKARAMPIIERGVMKASELVGSLADPEGRFRVRDASFDARVLVREVYDLLEARCQMKGVTLALESSDGETSAPLLARGDPSRVTQILVNLVLNATDAVLKAKGDAGGRVTLLAGMSPEQRIELAVRDEGVGMDLATLARIFDPFFTTRSETTDGLRGTGKGLGLAVSRSLAEAMGARLEVKSELGEGSEMILSLRRAPRPSEPAAAAMSLGLGDKLPLGVRVMVLDDEPSIRELLEIALGLRGAQVVAVGDVRSARRALVRGDVDVALIDETLGERESGATFMAEMSVTWPDVGRVLMTGAPSIDHIDEITCAAFVRKPFMLDDVVRALTVALESRRE